MLHDLLPTLVAQSDAVQTASQLGAWIKAAIAAAVIIGPFVLGYFIAKGLRMADYWWKVGLMLFCVAAGSVVVASTYNPKTGTLDLKQGVDLKGGTILIYEIGEVFNDGEATATPVSNPTTTVVTGDLIQAIGNRIDPSHTQEIVVRPYGNRQVEIIIPDVDPIEVERIKSLISTAGSLEFRIVASRTYHPAIVAAAEAQQNRKSKYVTRQVTQDGKTVEQRIGMWARVGREQEEKQGRHELKVDVRSDVIRDAFSGQIITDPIKSRLVSFDGGLAEALESVGIREVDVLMATDDGVDVTGDHLGNVSPGVDDSMQPCVNFGMKGVGVPKFSALTSNNLPDETGARRLGIVLDGNLLSAPAIRSTIADRGQITGQFSMEEIEFLVGILRAGRLPATLNKEPISENQVGSILGDDTIRKGNFAIGLSLVAVLFFIAIYYRFAGLVACLALLMNLLLILGLMIILKAPLTLPGMAGLVLTVGMSVDANVLIFERIREEMDRGAALRMAIRNGFAKATTTIVDANLTTLITALVLYVIGTDQIRGFAVTLILGILMSMFTAIFCSRVIFDIADRVRWLKSLSMMRILGATNIDFINRRFAAGIVSAVLIVVGLGAVVARGKQIFDIDFLGGTSVTMMLKAPMEVDKVRARVRKALGEKTQFSITSVDVDRVTPGTVFKVDSSVEVVDELQKKLAAEFREGEQSLLLTNSMTVGTVRTEQRATGPPPVEKPEPGTTPPGPGLTPPGATPPGPGLTPPGTTPSGPGLTPPGTTPEDPKPEAPKPEAPKPEAPKPEAPKPEAPKPEPGDSGCGQAADDTPETQPPATDPPATDPPATDPPATDPPATDPPATDPPATDPPATDPPATDPPATDPPATDPPATDPPSGPPTTDPGTSPLGQPPETTPGLSTTRQISTVELTFGQKINAPTLRDQIERTGERLNRPLVGITVKPKDPSAEWNAESSARYTDWLVTLDADQELAQQVFANLKSELEGDPFWPSSSTIGGKVAGDTRTLAIAALLTSLIGIVGYIWVRFQRVVYGLAAVVALIHDVLVTLGAIAVSAYLAPFLGILLIDEFKISLPVVAAFLTIIGYSLNDTIVVFDRVREVRGKSPEVNETMINTSINQTLSRTLLTSVTTLIVVVILYAIGGQGIHGFAFALVVGVMVGTYSSIFVASPVLLWMSRIEGDKKSKSRSSRNTDSVAAAP